VAEDLLILIVIVILLHFTRNQAITIEITD